MASNSGSRIILQINTRELCNTEAQIQYTGILHFSFVNALPGTTSITRLWRCCFDHSTNTKSNIKKLMKMNNKDHQQHLFLSNVRQRNICNLWMGKKRRVLDWSMGTVGPKKGNYSTEGWRKSTK
jgi:hypothetical protein